MFGVEYPRGYRDWVGNSELLSSFGSESGPLSIEQLKLQARAASLSKLEKVLQARALKLDVQEVQTLRRVQKYSDVLREPENNFKQASWAGRAFRNSGAYIL